MKQFSTHLIVVLAIFGCFLFGLGLFVGWGIEDSDRADSVSENEPKVLYWVAPMDPNFRSDKPGKSPMGMDLVPVYEEEGADQASAGIRISPEIVQNLGLRTAIVKRQDLSRDIEAVGYIGYDETKVTHVHLRTDGWIENLSVKSEGERVKKGDILFELYSPNLVNAQSEYLQSLQRGNRSLIESSTQRLKALGISDDQIALIEKNRSTSQLVTFRASQDGIIAKLNVAEGMYVQPGTTVATLADISSVWMLVDIFESQAPWMREGLNAQAYLAFLPGEKYMGRVEYIYPTLDPDTRALKVRLRFSNPEEALKPNMFANVIIQAHPIRNALTIPKEAVIWSGEMERVILIPEENRYQAIEVVTGVESGDEIEIQDGLREGDRVVTSGQFLIDSEASLTASVQRLSVQVPPEEIPSKSWSGMGVITSVMQDHNMLTINHEPIKALGWSAMTMNFFTSDKVSLADLKEGMTVHFSFEKQKDGNYLVTSVHVISAN